MVLSKITVISIVLLGLLKLSSSNCPKTVKVMCPCGNHDPPEYITHKVHVTKTNGKLCKISHKSVAAACGVFKNCEICQIDETGPVCIEVISKVENTSYKTYEQIKAFSSDPVVFKIPAEDIGKIPRRVARADEGENEVDVEPGQPPEPAEPEAAKGPEDGGKPEAEEPELPQAHDYFHDESSEDQDACRIEAEFATAEVKCWMWPTYISCEQQCISGYQIDGNSTRTAKCSYKKPKEWYPKPLEECKKFRNCHVKLITPGTLKCHLMSIENPHCFISCGPYDHFPYSPLREYECTDQYDPPLPHCAVLDTDYEVGTK